MYNISLSAAQAFNNNPASKAPQTGWIFSPPSPYTIYSFIGNPMPPDLTIQSFIKDYIFSMGTNTYTDFYVKMSIAHPVLNGQRVPMFDISGPIADATGDGYHLTQANLDVDHILDFDFINFPAGNYRAQILFLVYGKIEDFFFEFIETVRFNVDLVRLNVGDIYITPAGAVEMHYLLGGALPSSVSRNLYVNGAFTVTVGDHIALSGGNLVLVSDIDGIKTYSGSGNQTINFTLESSINSLPDPGDLYEVQALFNVPTMILAVDVKIHLYEAGNNRVFPESLRFTSIKGVLEAPYQSFTIEGFGAFTITHPNWLELEGSASGNNTTTKNIKPIHSDNLNPGFYSGKIKVVFASENYFINVLLEVVDSLQSGFSKTGINFTKDRDGISTIYGNNDNKVQLLMSIESYFYNSSESKILPADFTKGIFNGLSDFWLGDIAHKAMPSLKKLTDIGFRFFQNPGGGADLFGYKVFKYYNPAKIYFLMKYLNRETGDQVGPSKEYHDIQFLKGRKPKRFFSSFGIVDFKESPIRVTKKSFTLLPVFRNNSMSLIEIYRNGILYKKIYPDRGSAQLFGVQLSFAPFSQGDMIEARVVNLTTQEDENPNFSQYYIVFPEGKKSYHLVWENEHGILEAFEFTGDYEFKSEHKGVIARSFERYLEYTEKVATERTVQFSANTGWILKSNQERIDSLADANRAWIVFTEDREPIQLVPNDSKLTNVDSDAGTYQYDVAFTINPTHELENNTF